MKKLMIAAAAVALAGVTFADCDTPVKCAYAYRIKLAGKTVVGQAKTTGSEKTCDLESNCWARPASYRVVGYIYGNTDESGSEETCDAGCECNSFDGNEAIFWYANNWKQTLADVDSVTFDTFDILRNGGLKNKAQIAFKLGDLQLAGFGVYSPTKQLLKSANGFFAGTLAAPECKDCTEDAETCELDCETKTAQVYTLCDLATAKDADVAIAYGRWSLVYRADKVAKYSKNGDKGVFKPLYFTEADAPTPTPEP